MSRQMDLTRQINQLRAQLEETAERKQYNFADPAVMQLSRKLDALIVKWMQCQKKKNPCGI